MKRILCLCLCACLFTRLLLQAPIAQGQAKQGQPPAPASVELPLDHGGKIESKHDGFRHETVVALRKMSVTCADVKGGQNAWLVQEGLRQPRGLAALPRQAARLRAPCHAATRLRGE